MILGHFLEVANPRVNEVGGVQLHQFRLPAGTKVDEEFWPPRDVGPLNGTKDAGVYVALAVGRGKTVAEAVKKIGVTEQTYYRWKKQYGGLRIDQAKRLKDLEKENSRLKRLVADAELDKAILREAASG